LCLLRWQNPGCDTSPIDEKGIATSNVIMPFGHPDPIVLHVFNYEDPALATLVIGAKRKGGARPHVARAKTFPLLSAAHFSSLTQSVFSAQTSIRR